MAGQLELPSSFIGTAVQWKVSSKTIDERMDANEAKFFLLWIILVSYEHFNHLQVISLSFWLVNMFIVEKVCKFVAIYKAFIYHLTSYQGQCVGL